MSTMRLPLAVMLLCLLPYVLAVAEPARRIEAVPTCQSSVAPVPEGWSTFRTSQTKLRFSLPPGAQPVSEPQTFCIHGCEQWSRGSLTITVSHGIWGPESFSDEDWTTACVRRRGRLRIVEMAPDKNTTLLWPSEDGSTTLSTTDFILSVKFTDERDKKDAILVIGSLRLE